MECTRESEDIATCHAAERLQLWDRHLLSTPYTFYLEPGLMRSMAVTLERMNNDWGLQTQHGYNRYDITNPMGIPINRTYLPGDPRTSSLINAKLLNYLNGMHAQQADQVLDFRHFMFSWSGMAPNSWRPRKYALHPDRLRVHICSPSIL